jgi:hypothetical protein
MEFRNEKNEFVGEISNTIHGLSEEGMAILIVSYKSIFEIKENVI